MRRIASFCLVLLALTVGFSAPASAQRVDLKGKVNVLATLFPATRANTAATGAWADVRAAGSAVIVTHQGIMEPTTLYAVFQDSFPGLAVRTYDSVNVATDTTTHVRETAYLRNGSYVRVLLRASGGAGDSTYFSALVIAGNCRVQPC